MSRRTSKHSNWADLLQNSIYEGENPFLPTDKTAAEIREDMRKANLPCGIVAVRRTLSRMVALGKVKLISGSVKKEGCKGRVKAVKYRIL